MKHLIRLVEAPLSDGSPVYDVWLGNEQFPCVSLRDAEHFIDGIRDLIKRHTNEEVAVQ